ncbi:MAG: hypothetical protein DWQ05_18725 [Calditrichaeota bacterium]|nr:MAG: hypothetical protein DWQ05_18725 [Calditrichota bacterium]
MIFLNYSEEQAYTNLGISSGGNPWSYLSSEIHAFDFVWNNALITDYEKREENRFTLSLNLTKKWNSNRIKGGIQFEEGKHRYYKISVEALKAENTREYLERYYWSNLVENYGYNLYGEKIQEDVGLSDKPKSPRSTQFYLEDEVIFDQSIFTFGLNYISMNTGAYRDKNLVYPYWDRGAHPNSTYINKYETDRYHSYLLPHFSWQFKQNERFDHKLKIFKSATLPKLSDVYLGRTHKHRIYDGGWFYAFPKGPNANPVESSNIYLQTDYKYSSTLRLQFAVFHRKSETWLQTAHIETDTLGPASNYMTLLNNGENQGQGFELNFQINKPGVKFLANYTYSHTTGTASYPNSNVQDIALFGNDTQRYDFNPDKRNLLEFNQAHRLNAWLTMQADKNAAFALRNSSLTFLYHFNSGHTFKQYHGSFG